MSRRTLVVVSVLSALAAGAAPALAAAEDATDRYLVVFEQGRTQGAAGARTSLDAIRGSGGEVLRSHPQIGVAVATSTDPRFAARMRRTPGVVGVARDVLHPTAWSFDPVPFRADRAEAGWLVIPHSDPTDHTYDPVPVPASRLTQTFFYPFQWDLRRYEMDGAWAAGFTGTPDQLIAVVASGIDYTHLELQGRVNFELSRNFVPEDAAMVQDLYPGAHPIADLGFHGTYVSSLLVCNAFGMSCSVPNANLVGVKWLNMNEEGRVGDLVTAIEYASSIDADVIAVPDSIGRLRLSDPEGRAAYTAIKRAVNKAQAKGALVLGGAWTDFGDCGIDADGNGNEVILPAEAGMTVVAATGTEDQWSADSSYGHSLVDISGPGGQRDPVTCEVPGDVNVFSLGACSAFTHWISPVGFDFSEICNFENTPIWVFSLGVRPATAAVAATAVVTEERFGELKGQQVFNHLKHTADDVLTPGFDAFSGHGRVNARRAVTE